MTAQTLRFHRAPLNPTKLRVSFLLDELLGLYGSRLSASSIEVKLKVVDDAYFTAFESDVRQILNTWVGDAFDTMRQGGVLSLRAGIGRSWRHNHLGIVITVADNGPEIAPSILPSPL